MPLPLCDDEAGLRALEAKCASPTSSVSKNTVALLSEQLADYGLGYLWNSVSWGLPNIVRCALEAKISANARSPSALRRPVLIQVAISGSARILKLLLDAGADHGLVDSDGFTALISATQEGHLDCVQLLLAAGADANQAGPLGLTPLMKAILNRRSDCFRALLPVSNLLATNRMGRNALHISTLDANKECFELLLPLMSDPDVLTVPGEMDDGKAVPAFSQTALHLACAKGQQQMARALLKRGANRMARDSLQRTPLICAARGDLSCCVLLVGQPGRRKISPEEVNAVDVNGGTALHHAAGKGHEKNCGFLLEAGARLDARSISGHTPLMIAQEFHPTNATLHALLSGAGPAALPGTVCDHCGMTAAQASVNNLKACSNCHDARYCGAACSAAAWPGHKAACRARAKAREEATKPNIVQLPGTAGQAAAPSGASAS